MDTGFITPIQMPESLFQSGSVRGTDTADTENRGIFKDIFTNMVNDVNEAEAALEQQEYLLATGQLDDAHTVTIAASEAQMTVDLLVQMRNKALDSYNELMRISL